MTMTMEEKFESLFVAKAALIKIHQRAVLQVWRNNILSTPTYLLCTNENKRFFFGNYNLNNSRCANLIRKSRCDNQSARVPC